MIFMVEIVQKSKWFSIFISNIQMSIWRSSIFASLAYQSSKSPNNMSAPVATAGPTGGTESVQCFGRKKTVVVITHCKEGCGLIKINGCHIELVEPTILRFTAYDS
ncbi:hypothetical protein Dsin_006108 [Dipteronia sinensis]|uniref:Uncharacterized protein n=1 Tax=Dipteronia sinensis TaxID=43782 RepID=A0AAE0AXV7_9ROSI|nr:hypothetical protein Dsin_006108 [Dipteronia sinensis]